METAGRLKELAELKEQEIKRWLEKAQGNQFKLEKKPAEDKSPIDNAANQRRREKKA